MIPTPLSTRSSPPTASLSSNRSSNRIGSSFWSTISGNTANRSNRFSAAMENPSRKMSSARFVGHLTTTSTTTMAATDSTNAKSVDRPLSPAMLSPLPYALYALTAAIPSSPRKTGSSSASINASTPGVPSTFITSPRLTRTSWRRITTKTSISCTTFTGNSR